MEQNKKNSLRLVELLKYIHITLSRPSPAIFRIVHQKPSLHSRDSRNFNIFIHNKINLSPACQECPGEFSPLLQQQQQPAKKPAQESYAVPKSPARREKSPVNRSPNYVTTFFAAPTSFIVNHLSPGKKKRERRARTWKITEMLER